MGDIIDSGLSYRPAMPAYVAWRADMTTLRRRQPQGADPTPLSLRVAKAGRTNLGHAALLRRCELPL